VPNGALLWACGRGKPPQSAAKPGPSGLASVQGTAAIPAERPRGDGLRRQARAPSPGIPGFPGNYLGSRQKPRLAGGATAERGGTTPQLMRVWVDIQNAASCQADRQEGKPSVQITENMLCAGLPEGGRDACQGDLAAFFGAPIGNGKYVQLDIVSWRVGGARPSSSASMPGSGAMPRFGRRWPTSGLISPRNRVGKAPLDAE
jgi:Trypsin